MRPSLDFTGRTAVVTGAASGIGYACARAFAEAGASVVLADVDAEKNRAASAEIAANAPAGTLAIEADVAKEEDCRRLVEATLSRFGRVDALVNNAAIMAPGSVLDLPPSDFDRVLGVNLRGAFVLTQLVARAMIERGIKGAIVNLSSVNAEVAIASQAAYVTSKGGLKQLTKVSALALAEHGIRVNAVAPGSVATDMLQKVIADESARRTVLSRTPLGRLAEPSEIAALVLFLGSDLASYVTGETLVADGGRMALNYTVPVRE